MELIDLLYFMPAVVCLLWVITLLLSKKTRRVWMLLACLVIAVPYLILMTPVPAVASWVTTHAAVTLSLSVVLSVLLHLFFFSEHKVFSEHKAKAVKEEETVDTAVEENTAEEETVEENIVEEIIKADNDSEAAEEEGEKDELGFTVKEKRVANMFNSFTRLMVEEKVYLNPDITVNDVAERLFVGRSTLSNMINHGYGKNFRSVINDYRIYYAKQYMLDNPGSTQEMIAMKCGFKDASAFSHKFKEIVGTSPLIWLTSQTKKRVESSE